LLQHPIHSKAEEEKKGFEEKIKFLQEAKEKLSDTFKALSSEALSKNNRSFLDLANSTLEKFQEGAQHDLKARHKAVSELVSPIKEALTGVDNRIVDLEKSRHGAYEGLKTQLSSLITSQKELKGETANLVKALRTPNIRGRWGEMQLRRVVEISGMSPHCDFIEQASIDTEESHQRPDMIVRLPNNKTIIIDAKAPLAAYLDAIETEDETLRIAKFKDHARQVKNHINMLSSRAYWANINEDTPEFVVLFLPGETFFSTALEYDPTLIEEGVQKTGDSCHSVNANSASSCCRLRLASRTTS